jgi:hypothetical protein
MLVISKGEIKLLYTGSSSLSLFLLSRAPLSLAISLLVPQQAAHSRSPVPTAATANTELETAVTFVHAI